MLDLIATNERADDERAGRAKFVSSGAKAAEESAACLRRPKPIRASLDDRRRRRRAWRRIDGDAAGRRQGARARRFLRPNRGGRSPVAMVVRTVALGGDVSDFLAKGRVPATARDASTGWMGLGGGGRYPREQEGFRTDAPRPRDGLPHRQADQQSDDDARQRKLRPRRHDRHPRLDPRYLAL